MVRFLLAMMLAVSAAAQQTQSVVNATGGATSRYLRDALASQIAWQPWGKAAIDLARRSDRPIFLSIGYASSYDCYRLHRETFANPEVADTINGYFIPVLLDRIEYPEVAAAFEAMQPSTPANLVLTPDLEPIATAAAMAPGEMRVFLATNASRWANERAVVIAEAKANREKAQPRREVAREPVRDPIGGGFHRPDGFEKLLDDQASMAIAHLEAWHRTRDPQHEDVVRTTLDYVIRDQQRPKGAFLAAQDAHSLVPGQGPEFRNGVFYLWSKEELIQLLGRDDAAKAFHALGMEASEGNRPVLTEPLDPTIRQRMLEYRQRRPQPFRDFAELAGWNGLMISALSRAGAAFGERAYVDAATTAAQAITSKSWNAKTKTLYRSDAATAPVVEATAEDYAMLVQGLFDLFNASGDPAWLELANAIHAGVPRSSVPESLRNLVPGREDVNAIAALNAQRLAMPKVVVVVGDRRKKSTVDLLRSVHERWDPLRTVVVIPPKGAERERMIRAFPFAAALAPDPQQPLTYVCEAVTGRSGRECSRRDP